MSNATEHQQLVNDILVALSARGVLCWPIQTGKAISPTGRVVAYGNKGHGDIGGVIGPVGKALSIEVKTGKAREQENQRLFGAAFERAGGVRIVARSVDDAINAIEQAR